MFPFRVVRDRPAAGSTRLGLKFGFKLYRLGILRKHLLYEIEQGSILLTHRRRLLLCIHYLLKLLNRHGLIEVISLHLRTAGFLKIRCLLKRLNSLGNHLHPKRIDHLNHMGNNDSSPLKIARLSQEMKIQFDTVKHHLFQHI